MWRPATGAWPSIAYDGGMKRVPLPLGVLAVIIIVVGIVAVVLGFFQPWQTCTDGTASATGGACPTGTPGFVVMLVGFAVTLSGFYTMFLALRASGTGTGR